MQMQKKNKKKTTWRKMKKKILLFCLSIYLFILSSRWFVPILDCEVKTRGRLSLFDPKESRNRAQLVGRTINSLVPKEKQNNKKKKEKKLMNNAARQRIKTNPIATPICKSVCDLEINMNIYHNPNPFRTFCLHPKIEINLSCG